MKIIYKQDDGVLAIITLADETNIIDDAPQYVPNGKNIKLSKTMIYQRTLHIVMPGLSVMMNFLTVLE